MPYIKPEDRPELDKIVDQFPLSMNEGDMNYIFTKIAHRYAVTQGLCYKTLNAVVGVFYCCVAEFIRRVVSPYEDTKIMVNGGVTDLDGNLLEDGKGA